MIRLEEKAFEETVLAEENDIAVPIEVSVTADGAVDLLVYSFAEETARRFEKEYGGDPFSDEAKAFLTDQLSPVMESLGYETDGALTHGYLEYRCTSPDESRILQDCALIDTLDGETGSEELALDEFELDPGNPLDRMAVIRRNGRIVCYAGVNDLADDGVPELTVECDGDWRRQGFAASCAAGLTVYLTGLGYAVSYACAETNTASVRTAEAVGFEPVRRVMPFVCYRKDTEEA